MARKLDPGMITLLSAGAQGVAMALLTAIGLWFAAGGFGTSYEIDAAGGAGTQAIGITDVAVSVVVTGLAATAFALVLHRARRGAQVFALVSVLALAISIATPAAVAADAQTAGVLVAHHVLAGGLIAIPLLRSLGRLRTTRRST